MSPCFGCPLFCFTLADALLGIETANWAGSPHGLIGFTLADALLGIETEIDQVYPSQ